MVIYIYFYGNFLLRMWRHLLEMCIRLFIMLDARPHAIHLRPRGVTIRYPHDTIRIAILESRYDTYRDTW